MITVFMGTNNPAWLWNKPELTERQIPLFVSYLRMRNRRSGFPLATVPYAIDSGAFTVHDRMGGRESAGITPERFAGDIRRIVDGLGRANLRFVSIQDLMCEPWILDKTGLTIEDHQQRTVASYLTLSRIAPDLPWLPVLQGWRLEDYLQCLWLYRESGVTATYYGLGSVCRRQGTEEATQIIGRLGREGINLHLFGFKRDGLESVGNMGHVSSSDSMAWSFNARKNSGPCPIRGTKTCADCTHWAIDWYDETVSNLAKTAQKPKFDPLLFNVTKQLGLEFWTAN